MTTAPSASDLESANTSNPDDDSLGTQAEIENLGPCKLKVTAVVSKEKVGELLDKNYKDLISSLSLPGFRRGKVPRQLVEKRYGEEVEKDLKEALLNDSFSEVIEEKDLKVVGKPDFGDVEFNKEEDFKYEVEVEVSPEFEIEKYKFIEVEKEDVTVSDDDINEEVDKLLKDRGALAPVELADAGEDDYYYGTLNFVADGENLTEEPAQTMFKASDSDINNIKVEGIKDKVSGLTEETTITFENVEIDEKYYLEEVKGKTVNLELTVQDAKTHKPAEMNEEFLKKFEVETEDELRTKIRESLETRAEVESKRKIETAVLDKIEASVDFEVPEGVLDNARESAKARTRMQLMEIGRGKEFIDEELKKLETDENEAQLKKDLKLYFILEKIADLEKIFATEEDIQRRLMALSQMYGVGPEELAQQLYQMGQFDQIRIEIRHDKVREFLRDKAKITNEEPAIKAASSEEDAQESDSEASEE